MTCQDCCHHHWCGEVRVGDEKRDVCCHCMATRAKKRTPKLWWDSTNTTSSDTDFTFNRTNIYDEEEGQDEE